jgi:hypothetical protein
LFLQVGFAVMAVNAPPDGIAAEDSHHIDLKLFDPKMRAGMMRVTVALTQNVFAAWSTQTQRLLFLWSLSELVVPTLDHSEVADDLTLVLMKKGSGVTLSLLPLSHQLHPMSNWHGEGSSSCSLQWRSRINELLQVHRFCHTFRSRPWPFRQSPCSIELPQSSCSASAVIAVAPNIVWLLADPATIVIVHLLLMKEIGRVKVPVEKPQCVAAGDGIVVCWAQPGGSDTSDGSMLQVFRSSDCSIITQKYLPIASVRCCCVSGGVIWTVTSNGMVVVLSRSGSVLEEFDFKTDEDCGAMCVCASATFSLSSPSPDVMSSSVVVAAHKGALEFSLRSCVSKLRFSVL